MSHQSRTFLSSSSNTLWLTFPSETAALILRSQLLGLGPDHSLLCSIPEDTTLQSLTVGALVKGRSLFDGETYQFETSIQEIMPEAHSLRLTPPAEISHQAARVYPRLTVKIPGTARPLSHHATVLAVLPVTIGDLCPTGCQLTAPAEAWPTVASLQIFITCRLPGSSHNSKLSGNIEWIDPAPGLTMGIQFRFQSESDVARQDLLKWFTSQQAKLINTVV